LVWLDSGRRPTENVWIAGGFARSRASPEGDGRYALTAIALFRSFGERCDVLVTLGLYSVGSEIKSIAVWPRV